MSENLADLSSINGNSVASIHFELLILPRSSLFHKLNMRKFPKARFDGLRVRGMFITGLKIGLVAEGLALAVSYFLWNRMNSSRDFRWKIYQYSPFVLNSYYWIGETLGNLPIRQSDFQAWGIECKKEG